MRKILPLLAVGVLVLSGLGVGALSESEPKKILPSNLADEYDMVIISPEKFSSAVQPLIDHKNSVGVQTFLKIFKNLKKYHILRHSIDCCLVRCLGWNMVKKSVGGCIAYIGSSSTAWGETGDKNNDSIPDGVQTGYTSGLCTEFFRIYDENESILGEIYTAALSSVIINNSGRTDRIQCKCIQEFQLIGDPSLKIGGY